jgi:hypothetical protein
LKHREKAFLIAQIMVIALVIGGLPIAASPVIVQRESAPAFTLNICSPLAPYTIGAASCSLPTLDGFSFECILEDHGSAPDFIPAGSDRLIPAPDPPPPKSLI